jgi:hypothetical protein
MPMSNSEDKDQTASPSEQTSIAAASSSYNASTTLDNPAQVAPEELVTSSQFPTNTSGKPIGIYCLHLQYMPYLLSSLDTSSSCMYRIDLL